MGDQVGFDESDGDYDEDGLEEEGDEEGAAAEGADLTHREREDQGAGEEGEDGDEGLEPAPWFVGGLVGGTETEEDRVTCLRSVIVAVEGG